MGCSVLIAASLCGCGKKSTPETQQPPNPELTAKIAHAITPSDNWTEMEALAADRWAPIDGAADLEWDDETGVMTIGFGNDLNGVRWAGPVPVTPYTVELEARRISGSDFFCGLTFPVRSGNEHVSLIVGGWGGRLVGISSIDGMDASENSTASQQEFEDGRWYRIRVEVRDEHIQAWIDDKQVLDAHTEEQKLSLRPGPIESCAPLGVATWMTKAETRKIRWRSLGH